MEPEQTLRFALQFDPLTSAVPENHGWLGYVVLAFVLFNFVDFGIQTVVYFRVFIHFIRYKEAVGFQLVVSTLFIIVRLITGYLILLLIPPKLIWDLDFSHAIPSTLLVILCYGGVGIFLLFSLMSCLACLRLLLRGDIKAIRTPSNMEDKTSADSLPTVIILMPVYNEEPSALIAAVDSVVVCDYPQIKKHFFISFDDPSESELFRILAKHLSNEGVEIFLGKDSAEYVVNGVRITVNRFEHSGKRDTQAKSYEIIDRLYEKDDSARILFIDSDIVLHPNAIHNFIARNTVATTGLITCRTSQDFNLLQCLQDAEYLNDQVFIRSTEVLLGAATCLPGALTMTNMKTLREVAPTYFQTVDMEESIDYHRLHLGEDRYLTYLLLQRASEDERVGFQASAQCKTEAPSSFISLLKQRRRWFMGTCTNDIAMLLSYDIWIRIPGVMLFKFFSYGTAGVSLLTWAVCCIYVVAMGNPNIFFSNLFFFIAIGVFSFRFALNTTAALQLRRRKVVLFSIVFAFFNPIFVALVVGYSVWTWNVRSWGGPRSDSEQDEKPVGVDIV